MRLAANLRVEAVDEDEVVRAALARGQRREQVLRQAVEDPRVEEHAGALDAGQRDARAEAPRVGLDVGMLRALDAEPQVGVEDVVRRVALEHAHLERAEHPVLEHEALDRGARAVVDAPQRHESPLAPVRPDEDAARAVVAGRADLRVRLVPLPTVQVGRGDGFHERARVQVVLPVDADRPPHHGDVVESVKLTRQPAGCLVPPR
eukprot:761503-Prymnesium_polylepis.2